MEYKNGDIFMAELGNEYEGSIQGGERPVLIVSNNKANEYSQVITIIPISSRVTKKKLPTHVKVEKCGLAKPSIVLAEQITSINKTQLLSKIGSICQTEYEKRVKNAIGIQLAM